MVTAYNKKLESLSTIDPLTDLLNRREFSRQLKRSFYRNERYGAPLSMIIIDLDNFKKINDTEGHPAGDQVLIAFSRFLLSLKRADDVLARWGGDEFIMLLESNLKESEAFAKRLIAENRTIGIAPTLSIGVAQLKENETTDSLISRADKALYLAKNNGRNQTVVAD